MKVEKEILDSYQTTMRFDDQTRQDAESLFNQYKSKQHDQMVNRFFKEVLDFRHD